MCGTIVSEAVYACVELASRSVGGGGGGLYIVFHEVYDTPCSSSSSHVRVNRRKSHRDKIFMMTFTELCPSNDEGNRTFSVCFCCLAKNTTLVQKMAAAHGGGGGEAYPISCPSGWCGSVGTLTPVKCQNGVDLFTASTTTSVHHQDVQPRWCTYSRCFPS